MKLKLSKLAILLSLTSAFFVGCADNETPQENISAYYVMDKWMKENRPDVPFIDSGYYSKITKPDTYLNEIEITDSTLVEFYADGAYIPKPGYDYGDVFLNSDPYKARQLGQFTYKTRYVPFRIIASNYAKYPFTNVGVYATMLKMKVGESAEIFLTGNNSYGDIENPIEQYLGFGGAVSYVANSFSSFNIKIEKVEPSPKDTVINLVMKYAKEVLKLKESDSVRRGMYIKRIDSIGGGHFIGDADTTLQLRYTGKFLDGFVFDTNVKEVAEEHNIYNAQNSYSTYPLKTKVGKDDTSSSIDAFYESVKHMKIGDKAVMVSIPEWCYGADGNFAENATLIQSYMPLIFEIEIVVPE